MYTQQELAFLEAVLIAVVMNMGLIAFSTVGIFRIVEGHPSWAWWKAGVVCQAIVLFGGLLSILNEKASLAEFIMRAAITVLFIVLFRFLTQITIDRFCEK